MQTGSAYLLIDNELVSVISEMYIVYSLGGFYGEQRKHYCDKRCVFFD